MFSKPRHNSLSTITRASRKLDSLMHKLSTWVFSQLTHEFCAKTLQSTLLLSVQICTIFSKFRITLQTHSLPGAYWENTCNHVVHWRVLGCYLIMQKGAKDWTTRTCHVYDSKFRLIITNCNSRILIINAYFGIPWMTIWRHMACMT